MITNWRLCANRKDNMSLYRFRKEAWSSRKKLPDTTSTITTTVITITTTTTTTIITTTINLGSTRYSVFGILNCNHAIFTASSKKITRSDWNGSSCRRKVSHESSKSPGAKSREAKTNYQLFYSKFLIPKVILIFFKVFVPKNSNPYLFIYYV